MPMKLTLRLPLNEMAIVEEALQEYRRVNRGWAGLIHTTNEERAQYEHKIAVINRILDETLGMEDASTCGYKGDPVCSPPDCAGACPPHMPDFRPARP